jgi:porphobilinogen synthase
VSETQLSANNLINSFLSWKAKSKKLKLLQYWGAIAHYLDVLPKDVTEAFELEINVIALFPVILENKRNNAETESCCLKGSLQQY